MDGALYADYIGHYECGGRRGSVGLYRSGERGGTRAPEPLYTQFITDKFVMEKPEGRAGILGGMMKGFAILEMVCVNLFLYPWRKEIRTLKKFTGNFVYFVEPFIPEKMVTHVLQRVGYSIAHETEYIIGGTINIEEAKHTAFQLCLARLYCEELISLIHKNKDDCLNALPGETNVDAPTDLRATSEHQTGSSSETGSTCEHQAKNADQGRDIYGLSINSENIDSRDTAASLDPPAMPAAAQDESAMEHHYSYSRILDSEEFLNNYSDLNLAQQPILPLQSRKINSKPQELREERPRGVSKESTFLKAFIPESFSKEPERDLFKVKDVREDMAILALSQKSDSSNVLSKHGNEPPDPKAQKQPERLVIKLKMGNVANEWLTYPIEETVPPDSSNSGDLCQKDPKWTFLKKQRAAEEETSSLSFSSNVSMLNVTPSRAPERGDCPDNLYNLREPPSSMYIPPGGADRQCLKITNSQPEENHYQAPSPLTEQVVVRETVLKVNEDTKEDFVVITRKEHLKN
ncbi:uncharacterized protein PAF06_015284 [Gastrophryne carolinensis]